MSQSIACTACGEAQKLLGNAWPSTETDDIDTQLSSSNESCANLLSDIAAAQPGYRLDGSWLGLPHLTSGAEDCLDVNGFGWLKAKLLLAIMRQLTPKLIIQTEGQKVRITSSNYAKVTNEVLTDGSEFHVHLTGLQPMSGVATACWKESALVVTSRFESCTVQIARDLLKSGRLMETLTVTKATRSAVMTRFFEREG